jgi:hypothetical protein
VACTPDLANDNGRLVQEEIGHTQKQSLHRLLRQGIISEEIYGEFIARIDENLRRPEASDWTLSAHLMEALKELDHGALPDDVEHPGNSAKEPGSAG